MPPGKNVRARDDSGGVRSTRRKRCAARDRVRARMRGNLNSRRCALAVSGKNCRARSPARQQKRGDGGGPASRRHERLERGEGKRRLARSPIQMDMHVRPSAHVASIQRRWTRIFVLPSSSASSFLLSSPSTTVRLSVEYEPQTPTHSEYSRQNCTAATTSNKQCTAAV